MNAIHSVFASSSTIRVIKEKVAAEFGLRVAYLDSERRAAHVARPRQVAMFLAREMTSRSMPQIGAAFGGRDHTTVMHAIRRVEKRLAEDPAFARVVEKIRADVAAAPPSADELQSEDVDRAAEFAQRAAVERGKKEIAATAIGRWETIRRLLRDDYGELRVATGVNKAGVAVELLVSPSGTWTLLEAESASGPRARIAAAGVRWSPVSNNVKYRAKGVSS